MSIDKDLYKKIFLITGASGFIGSALTKTLLEKGSTVHALYRTNQLEPNKNLISWQGDCSDYSFIHEVIHKSNPDVVYHLAGFVSGTRDIDAILPAYNNNLTSTVNLLTCLAKKGCEKVVLAGSMEEPDLHENTVIPSSPYAASKWACNGYANMFRELYNVPIINTRLFMVYGPGQYERKKLIPYLILSYLNNERPVIRSVNRLIDWIYIDDVVDGLLSTSKFKSSDEKRIDIGSGNQVSVGFLANLLYELIEPDCDPPLVKKGNREMEQVKVANMDDTSKKINWKPKTTLRDGLRKTISWYKEMYM